jgi:hypothetical protein
MAAGSVVSVFPFSGMMVFSNRFVDAGWMQRSPPSAPTLGFTGAAVVWWCIKLHRFR